METSNEENVYYYYKVYGGINQIKINIDMNINTRFQRKSSKFPPKNIVEATDCINGNWKDLLFEINELLKKEELELIHYNVDK